MNIPLPDRVEIVVMTNASLRTYEGLEQLLNAFERSEELIPTHWGPDERARNPYQRNQILETVTAFRSEFYMPGLHRRKPPRYKAYFSAKNEDLNYISIEFGSTLRKIDLARVFALGDALATQLKAEFGIVHIVWLTGSQEYCASGRIHASKLQAYGLKPVCARTWFGPYLVDLMGRERLENSGALTQGTPWGGLQMDLVQNPWESDVETLSSRQHAVMQQLLPSGVFGDYTTILAYQPGPNWKPIPTPNAPERPENEPTIQPATQIAPPVLRQLQRAIGLKEVIRNVDLSGLVLHQIDLTGLLAEGLVARGTVLPYALLTGAQLLEADFTEANLDGAHLGNTNVGLATFDGASLRGAWLEHALFINGFCKNANVEEADFTGADLEGTLFFGSCFNGARLQKVHACATGFNRAQMIGANLQGGNFVEASFNQADLTGANLCDGDFSGADFRGAKLDGVIWKGARLTGARFDTQTPSIQ